MNILKHVFGVLICLCILAGLYFAFSQYVAELRFQKGVTEPVVVFENLNETGMATSSQDCLNEHRIPSELRDGIVYISEEHLSIATMVCA